MRRYKFFAMSDKDLAAMTRQQIIRAKEHAEFHLLPAINAARNAAAGIDMAGRAASEHEGRSLADLQDEYDDITSGIARWHRVTQQQTNDALKKQRGLFGRLFGG